MPWDGVHLFECPTRVFYGRGVSSEVGRRLGELGVSRALLVSDSGVAGAGIVDRIAGHMRDAGLGVAVYAETQPNPTAANAAGGAALYRGRGCGGNAGLGA